MALDPTASADRLASLTGVATHDVAVVLGSGWSEAAKEIGPTVAEVPLPALGGFPEPTVTGHQAVVRSQQCGTRRVLTFLGRLHAYEGHPLDVVAHEVRTAVAAGCRVVVLTNAAGGLDPAHEVGSLVLLADHLNLTGRSPLVGPRFVDLTDLYSARLRTVARSVDPALPEGVYAGLPGPHFETPAEIRMLRTLGADLVGMSTVHEAIAAHAEGAEVLGISLVTNAAAGTPATSDHGPSSEGASSHASETHGSEAHGSGGSGAHASGAHASGGTPIDHLDVLAVGRASAARAGQLIAGVIARL